MDIEGLSNSDIVLCLLDNYDPGTLIEAGIAISQRMKLICYHRTCEKDKLMMLGSGESMVFNTLTTAIYQTIWNS